MELLNGAVGQHEVILKGLRILFMGSDQFSDAMDGILPAFQSIHELPRRFQAFAHKMRLLLNHCDGIVQQSRLIFHSWRTGHGEVRFRMRAQRPVKLKQLSLTFVEVDLRLTGASCE